MFKISTKARQMMQSLLMSEDIETGTLMYEVLTDKKKPEIILATEKDDAKKIFLSYVFNGDFQNAITTCNEDNKTALLRMNTLQKLQSLLACTDHKTSKFAYNVLSGRHSFEFAKTKTDNNFLKALLDNDKSANALASNEQIEALLVNGKSKHEFELNTAQNLHRLHYIMLDQQLTLDQVINTMIKAFYETIRADDYAELLGDDQPQNFLI